VARKRGRQPDLDPVLELALSPNDTKPRPRTEAFWAAVTEPPRRLQTDYGESPFFAISATAETAADVTIEELVIESFYPADAAAADRVRALTGVGAAA